MSSLPGHTSQNAAALRRASSNADHAAGGEPNRTCSSATGAPAAPSRVADTDAEIAAVVEACATLGVNAVVADPTSVWDVLTTLSPEIRQAFQIVRADHVLSERLETIAKEGLVPIDVLSDPPLEMAGLIHRHPQRNDRVEIRAPVFAALALAG